MAVPDEVADHPARSAELVGHEPAEQRLLAAVSSQRLPHAWMLSGPRGIGKATLAYRFARFLLAGEAEQRSDTLEIDSAAAVFQRVAAGAHGNLMVVERGWDERRKSLRGEIVIDDVRRVHDFFSKTAAEGGWRICIVDSADEMNRNAANALLKVLEEPPPASLLLLVAHAPGRLMPTIRSRCRRLAMGPLSPADVAAVLQARKPGMTAEEADALAVLAEGAPGRAMALAEEGGLETYREMVALLDGMPGLDIPEAHRLAAALGQRNAEARYRLFTDLLVDWVARMVRRAARGNGATEAVPGEGALQSRLADALALDRWAELWERMRSLVARAEAVHLERKQVVLRLLSMMDEAARGRMPA